MKSFLSIISIFLMVLLLFMVYFYIWVVGLSFLFNLEMLNMCGISDLVGGFGVGGWCTGFVLVVLVILCMILMFTILYMALELDICAFQWSLFWFVSGMLLLLLSISNYSVLMGWEILGVSSFLLILYYMSRSSYGGSMMTILLNRWGDIGLVLFMISVFSFCAIACNMSCSWGMGVFSGVLLVLCVLSKSAQYPFCGWLPMAMVAPTPVSALVHSSTLVVAGLVLMGFSLWLLNMNSGSMLCVLGVFTLFSAGLSAMYELDVKKMVALSTLFHLGLMSIMGVSISVYFMFLHMVLHAFYKSLLFLLVGWAIMLGNHEQDARGLYGGGWLWGWMGVLYISVIMSLIGLLYFSGWVTKDFFMEMAMSSSISLIFIFILWFGLGCSLAYSLNLLNFIGGEVCLGNVLVSDFYVSLKDSCFLLLYMVVSVILGLFLFNVSGVGFGAYMSGVGVKLSYIIVSFIMVYILYTYSSNICSSMLYMQDIFLLLLKGGLVWCLDLVRVDFFLSVMFEGSIFMSVFWFAWVLDFLLSWDLIFMFMLLLLFSFFILVF
uniref:NADH:ubiquinone reductase (H(+)-translocating) n=1 Tax=Leptorhynchoides thecatus TaxID=60532 RepID=Q5DNB8_LEPTH|nr:NADH dehydrogenase subunit 5 [Leptorhynchoides thecatus]AAT64939.1 NADH dehydrogenase subunit 5 [Leptorhynchoides thecatus]